jgi:hypothetical protein
MDNNKENVSTSQPKRKPSVTIVKAAKRGKKEDAGNDISLQRDSQGQILAFIFPTESFAEQLIISPDDPLFMLDSKEDAIIAGLNAYNIAPVPLPALVPPAPFPGYPLSPSQLKSAIMQHLQSYTAGTIVGDSYIGPNTLVEYANIITRLFLLSLDPFVAGLRTPALGNGALFAVYLCRDATKVAAATPSPLPNAGILLPAIL